MGSKNISEEADFDYFISKATKLGLTNSYKFEQIKNIYSNSNISDFREIKTENVPYFLGIDNNIKDKIFIFNKDAQIIITHDSFHNTFHVKNTLVNKGSYSEYWFCFGLLYNYIIFSIHYERKYDHYCDYDYMIDSKGNFLNCSSDKILLYDNFIIRNNGYTYHLYNKNYKEIGYGHIDKLRNISRGYIKTYSEIFDLQLNAISENEINYFEDLKIIECTIKDSKSEKTVKKFEYRDKALYPVFKTQYDFAINFLNNRAWVLNANDWELIDKKGNTIVKIPKRINTDVTIEYEPYYKNLAEFDDYNDFSLNHRFRTNGIFSDSLFVFREVIFRKEKIERNIIILDNNINKLKIINEKSDELINNWFHNKSRYVFIMHLDESNVLHIRQSYFFCFDCKFITSKSLLNKSDFSNQDIKIYEIYEAYEKIEALDNISNKVTILKMIKEDLINFITLHSAEIV